MKTRLEDLYTRVVNIYSYDNLQQLSQLGPVKQDIIYRVLTGAQAKKFYMWNGSAFDIVGAPVNTDELPEGTVNKYYNSVAVLAASPWQHVGNPSNQNISQGPSATTNSLGTSYGNILHIEIDGLVLSQGCNYNIFGARLYNVTMGTACSYNTFGTNSGPLTIAGSFSYNNIGDNVVNCTFGLGVQNLTVGDSCHYLQVGANCRRVEIYNCSGTAAVPFVIPAGTVDAIYRNNALYTTAVDGDYVKLIGNQTVAGNKIFTSPVFVAPGVTAIGVTTDFRGNPAPLIGGGEITYYKGGNHYFYPEGGQANIQFNTSGGGVFSGVVQSGGLKAPGSQLGGLPGVSLTSLSAGLGFGDNLGMGIGSDYSLILGIGGGKLRVTNNGNLTTFIVDTFGNVGIGNSNPQYKLHIGSGENTNVTTGLGTSTEYGAPVWSFKQAPVNYTSIGFANGTLSGGTSLEEALVITRTGNIGIGTNTPSFPLDVQRGIAGTSPSLYTKSDILIGPGASLFFNGQFSYGQTWIGYQPGFDFSVVSGGFRTTFAPNGNVGFGVTVPTEKLHVEGRVYTTEGIRFVDNSVQTKAAPTTTDGLQEGSTNLYYLASRANLKQDKPTNTNTNYGVNTGVSNTTGYDNSFIGNKAGFSNTTGYGNSFLGNQAGFSNTTGAFNSFLGNQAGFSNTTGFYNCFLGISAGYSTTTGYNNTFIGIQAGFSNTTGFQNAFIGHGTGYSNTTGGSNSFLGIAAGYNNTTGGSNAFIGIQAGNSNTIGGSNSFLGSAAGFSNTTGNNNSFLGSNAGYNNTTGAANSALGIDSGPATGILTNTTALGTNAKPTVSNTVIIGNAADSANRVGIGTTTPQQKLEVNGRIRTAGIVTSAATNQTFLGFNAGGAENNSAGGDGLTFIGSGAGNKNFANNQTIIGVGAGRETTSGPNNTIIGCYAGQNNTTGQNNVMLGHFAGRLASVGSQNLFIGSLSGQGTSGNNNTFVGFNAGGANTTGSDNIGIGSSSGPATGLLINTISIGNGAQATVDNTLYITNTVNVGMGVLMPTSKLQVAGMIHSETGGFKFPDGTTESTAGATVVNLEKVRNSVQFSTSQAADYTLVAADAGNLIPSTGAVAQTWTVPANVFTTGQVTEVLQNAAGQVSLVAGVGMTLTGAPGLKTTGSPGSRVHILITSPTTAYVYGTI